jgi:hypothetical protein
MHRQIVRDDDIAALERLDEDLLHITQQHHTGCGHSAQTRHESDGLAMSLRCIADQTSPRGLRPRLRTMSVLVQVSSMNTSFAGSSMPCSTSARTGYLDAPLLLRVKSFCRHSSW